jgi:3-hydroxyisobutyrate dehydrogenase-like beta-hydroxyacid dehydrogenase
MAGHLAAAGHEVVVFNRTASRAEAWVARHGGRAAPSPAEAARGAEVVCTCVGDDDDVRAVTTATGGALGAMAPGTVLVDHTTASAGLARELHAAGAEVGVGVLDAPVSGGQAGAEEGRLTVMVGGDVEPFERAAPVLAAYGRTVVRLGPPGSGQLTKMVNQVCIAGVLQGLAEGLDLGRRAGLDLAAVLSVIGSGAAGSWQLDNRGPTMVEGRFDFGFAVDWMRKDLRIGLEEARQLGASLPLAALVDQFYARIQQRGGGRWDTSSLITLLSDP